MSRIETRVQTPIQRSDSTPVSPQAETNPLAGNAAAKRVRRLKSREWNQQRPDLKKQGGIQQPTQVQAADIQPLRDRRREDLITDITRILHTIERIEELEGEDDTTRLCKVMLTEHARRLMLVQGTQIESDGLKGTA